MISWPAPSLPAVPGAAVPVELYDRLTERLAPVRADGTVRTYACGLTPYDSTHLGHAATYLAGDLLHRVLIDNGCSVLSVQNITDIDDPLLERADRDGVDWQELAGRETRLFRDDMDRLGVIPPDHFVGVAESIFEVAELVRQLRDLGVAYDVDGDLYFAVHSDPRFGELSGLDPATMRTLSGERGGDPDRPGKKDPLDCLVWQAERPGEAEILSARLEYTRKDSDEEAGEEEADDLEHVTHATPRIGRSGGLDGNARDRSGITLGRRARVDDHRSRHHRGKR